LLNAADWEPRPTVIPVPESLPPAERRRVGGMVRLALAAAFQACAAAGREPASLPSVFASSGGDGQNCHEICQSLTEEVPQISPTRFHNSVHNAAAGYWGIATGAMKAANAVCAFDASFAAGLLEAATQLYHDRRPLLLVAYDVQYPPPLYAKRPIPDAFAIALVLAPDSAARTDARLMISLGQAPAAQMADERLEFLRRSIPAARALPLLQAIARRAAGTVALDYLDASTLSIEITPCS